MSQDTIIATAILKLAKERGSDKTICPSEVARYVAGLDEALWRPLMEPIRCAAIELADGGKIEIKKGGMPVEPQTFTGIYRIGVKPS